MFHKICCAYDGSSGAGRALAAALQLAQEQAATLYIVTVQERAPRYTATIDEIEEQQEEGRQHAQQISDEAQRQAPAHGVASEVAIPVGHPAQAILHFLEAGHVDLRVIGQSGHSEIWGRFLGSTIDKVVRHAPCSVLIVRGTV